MSYSRKVDIVSLIEHTIEALGYVGIALLMYAETVIPIIPSEIIMPFAGFAAGSGELSLVGVGLAGVVGSLLGALTLYSLAHLIKDETVYAVIGRYGSWVGLTPGNFKRAEEKFDRHNRSSVFFGRLIPGIRSVISLPAGIRKMPIAAFTLFTFFGVTVWTGVLTYLGFLLGDRYEQIGGAIGTVSSVVVAALLLAMGVAVLRAVIERKKSRK